MNKKIKILHLEDSVNDSELIHSLIESGGIFHDYFLTDNEIDFVNILENKNIDIILSDYSLPIYSGSDALKISKEKYFHIPFIFVSGAMGEDRAINAMLKGATDYVLKNKLERLVPAIKRALHERELEITRKIAEIALHESEQKYKNLVNDVNDGYFVTNLDGVITFANLSIAKILGFSKPEELIGHDFIEFAKTSNITRITSAFKLIIEDKTKLDGLEMEVLRIDCTKIYIEIKAVPMLKNDIIIGIQGVIHDITERKQAEINLKEKNLQIEAQNEKYFQINKELIFQNEEKEKRASELIIANIELVFQKEEKAKRAAELVIANIQKEVEEKYKILIEKKNLEITDSINYAKRIQQAKLPRKEEIYASLPDSFILFKPKNIVSGDFYFFHKNNDSVFIAVADCTGHGVPGALMSMIGSEKLDEAFSQSIDLSEILKLLNLGIKNSLHQTGSRESSRDGMDIAICSVDTKNRIVKYAGANIPFWLVRNEKIEVEAIRGTDRAIGGLTADNQFFDSHEVRLEIGDTFYLATDGYSDQFGGEFGKKIMKKNLKKILLEIQDKPMLEQKAYLDTYLENWRNGSEQIDDVLIIGVRI